MPSCPVRFNWLAPFALPVLLLLPVRAANAQVFAQQLLPDDPLINPSDVNRYRWFGASLAMDATTLVMGDPQYERPLNMSGTEAASFIPYRMEGEGNTVVVANLTARVR
jgi:hypothetical protein